MKTFRIARILMVIACSIFLSACSSIIENKEMGKIEVVGDGVYLFNYGTQRSLFMVADEGVIVTDPLNINAAQAYQAAIKTITSQPVKYVVYSHYHWDRISGAQIFGEQGAQVVAQEKCAERLIDNPNSNIVSPDIIFDNQYKISLGSHALSLYYFGPSHGDCLTVFVAEPAGLIQIVDLVEPPSASFPLNPYVSYVRPHNLREFFSKVLLLIETDGIQKVLASNVRLIGQDNTNLTFSPATASTDIIASQARFWDSIYEAVEIARREGNVGIDGFVRLKTIDTKPFEAYAGYRKEDLPIIMRRFSSFYDMGR